MPLQSIPIADTPWDHLCFQDPLQPSVAWQPCRNRCKSCFADQMRWRSFQCVFHSPWSYLWGLSPALSRRLIHPILMVMMVNRKCWAHNKQELPKPRNNGPQLALTATFRGIWCSSLTCDSTEMKRHWSRHFALENRSRAKCCFEDRPTQHIRGTLTQNLEIGQSFFQLHQFHWVACRFSRWILDVVGFVQNDDLISQADLHLKCQTSIIETQLTKDSDWPQPGTSTARWTNSVGKKKVREALFTHSFSNERVNQIVVGAEYDVCLWSEFPGSEVGASLPIKEYTTNNDKL